jgi:hypothetical protein
MAHEDLRNAAVQAIAAYMQHRFYDDAPGIMKGMTPFLKDQASALMDGCDRAIIATIDIGKEKGLI